VIKRARLSVTTPVPALMGAKLHSVVVNENMDFWVCSDFTPNPLSQPIYVRQKMLMMIIKVLQRAF
jgi:hypothetical protein